MNESFFGQYSVFCVFGSVVGCVVVPLIAQVLQQQSMECVILSAIVLSLTAAHLNKKGGADSSKVLLAKEVEKKKLNHISNPKKQKYQTTHTHPNINSNSTNGDSNSSPLENEYMQQQHYEHLKVIEMERRTEEKRLKKVKKREERLKKREEEHKKQKESEERNRNIKEKRQQQKQNVYRNSNSAFSSSLETFEKYCQSDHYSKKTQNGSSAVDDYRPRKHNFSCSQRIPRFERSRAASTESGYSNKTYQHLGGRTSVTGTLTIGCSSLSTSCSSLSSIGSSDSSSPPLPSSPPPCGVNQSLAWKLPCKKQQYSPSKSKTPWSNRSIQSPITEHITKTPNSHPLQQHDTEKASLSFDSSSLFCTQQDKRSKAVSGMSFCGEYSLFGPQKFTNNLGQSTVM